jgi:hypothetical protein
MRPNVPWRPSATLLCPDQCRRMEADRTRRRRPRPHARQSATIAVAGRCRTCATRPRRKRGWASRVGGPESTKIKCPAFASTSSSDLSGQCEIERVTGLGPWAAELMSCDLRALGLGAMSRPACEPSVAETTHLRLAIRRCLQSPCAKPSRTTRLASRSEQPRAASSCAWASMPALCRKITLTRPVETRTTHADPLRI